MQGKLAVRARDTRTDSILRKPRISRSPSADRIEKKSVGYFYRPHSWVVNAMPSSYVDPSRFYTRLKLAVSRIDRAAG